MSPRAKLDYGIQWLTMYGRPGPSGMDLWQMKFLWAAVARITPRRRGCRWAMPTVTG